MLFKAHWFVIASFSIIVHKSFTELCRIWCCPCCVYAQMTQVTRSKHCYLSSVLYATINTNNHMNTNTLLFAPVQMVLHNTHLLNISPSILGILHELASVQLQLCKNWNYVCNNCVWHSMCAPADISSRLYINDGLLNYLTIGAWLWNTYT